MRNTSKEKVELAMDVIRSLSRVPQYSINGSAVPARTPDEDKAYQAALRIVTGALR